MENKNILNKEMENKNILNKEMENKNILNKEISFLPKLYCSWCGGLIKYGTTYIKSDDGLIYCEKCERKAIENVRHSPFRTECKLYCSSTGECVALDVQSCEWKKNKICPFFKRRG